MAAVVATLGIIMLAGAGLMNGTGTQARKAGADLLVGMIEQARTAAITTRSCVVLAVAEPDVLTTPDDRCRLALFKTDLSPDAAWPASGAVKGVIMARWRTLENGVLLIGGPVDGADNILDGRKLTITYGTDSAPLTITAHAIAFGPRGGLQYPQGSSPVAVRIAEGARRGGKATPNIRGNSANISESRLKIGRVTARPYRIDG